MLDDLRALAQSAKRQGWRVEQANNSHWKFFAPNGKDIVVIGSSISDRRAYRNNLSRLRRAGFKEE